MAALGGCASALAVKAQGTRVPNIVLILADDLGYGDLGCYGSRIPTPNIDRLASEGVRLTRFYSASPVCSPSRAALLTGKYPPRTGVPGVLMPDSEAGLPSSETTIPVLLKRRGYRTACVGKWHLGTRPDNSPLKHFDEFFGIPYSNDMLPLPLMSEGQTLAANVEGESLTDRFTSRAVDFISRSRENPFFLYLAHTAPHIPLQPPARFLGQSGHGGYGDVVMALDWSVGQIVQTLKDQGVEDNTLLVFTSDNGPWYQGSAGRLQGRKGSTYEGGVREPMIARFPGRIPAGSEASALCSMMDLLPTCTRLAGAGTPSGIDGVDIWPVLTGDDRFPGREPLLFFDNWQIQCVRWGPWKLHLSRYNSYAWAEEPAKGRWNLPLPRPELYNIDEDPEEAYDMASEKPQVVATLRARVQEMLPYLPQQVRDAWQSTVSQKVWDTPAGALPRRD